MAEQFFFDEFFADDEDPGIEIKVTIKGKQVPIRIKRGLSLEDRAEAELMALKTKMGENGLEVVGIDEKAAMREMVFRAIKSWPFKDRATGEPTPITRENVMKMLGGGDEIMKAITVIDKQGEDALGPFEPASPAA